MAFPNRNLSMIELTHGCKRLINTFEHAMTVLVDTNKIGAAGAMHSQNCCAAAGTSRERG